jgi:hypothetical protein
MNIIMLIKKWCDDNPIKSIFICGFVVGFIFGGILL